MRIRNIRLTVGGVELKCRARSVNLDPLSGVVLCTDDLEYEMTAEIELTYGATGTWNQLNALVGTSVAVVLAPLDSTVATSNPEAQFNAFLPPIPFIAAAPDEVGTFTLTIQSEGGVVFDTTP